jgi:predicted amino acid dehydrogenase
MTTGTSNTNTVTVITVYNQYMTTGTSNTNTVTVITVYNQYSTTGTSNTNTATVITVYNQNIYIQCNKSIADRTCKADMPIYTLSPI